MHRRLPVAAVVTACAVVGAVAWSPWSTVTGGEGGTGRAVAAPRAAAAAVPDDAAGRSTSPLSTPAAAAAGVGAPVAPAGSSAPASPDSGWIATLAAPTAWSATPGGPVGGTLGATNPFGTHQVLAVVGRPGDDGWAQVELPVRPNGSRGWIRTTGATLTVTGYRIDVALATHTLTVTNGGATVLSAPVAIGAPRTATPTGQTYVWELVRPDNPASGYGPYILGLAMFSTSIAVFNGGDAQIAVHGNGDASSLGRAVSHGCVRVDNATISTLAATIPLGTPVTVH